MPQGTTLTKGKRFRLKTTRFKFYRAVIKSFIQHIQIHPHTYIRNHLIRRKRQDYSTSGSIKVLNIFVPFDFFLFLGFGHLRTLRLLLFFFLRDFEDLLTLLLFLPLSTRVFS